MNKSACLLCNWSFATCCDQLIKVLLPFFQTASLNSRYLFLFSFECLTISLVFVGGVCEPWIRNTICSSILWYKGPFREIFWHLKQNCCAALWLLLIKFNWRNHYCDSLRFFSARDFTDVSQPSWISTDIRLACFISHRQECRHILEWIRVILLSVKVHCVCTLVVIFQAVKLSILPNSPDMPSFSISLLLVWCLHSREGPEEMPHYLLYILPKAEDF